MKKKLPAIILLIVLFVSLAIPSGTQAASKLKLSKAKAILEVDAKLTLKLGDIKATDVKWSSSAKKVATVSKSGVVTAKASGNATITATYEKKKYTCSVTVVDSNAEEENSGEKTTGKVEIIAEYTLPDGIGWYTRHFMVIKNGTNKTVDVSTSSLAYNKAGEIIGAEDAKLYALGAGCVSILYEAYDIDGEIDHYETSLETSSGFYKSVIQDITYTKNEISGGAVFQLKNNGKEAAEFVEGYALFFLNGKLVDYETAYFTDDDFGLKPGKTISKQFKSYKEFDSIEFYFDGRR